MTNNEKMQRVIAELSAIPWADIKLSKKIKNIYVGEELKDSLANIICKAWEAVNCTKLNNGLFDTLKTGKAILDEFEITGEDIYEQVIQD